VLHRQVVQEGLDRYGERRDSREQVTLMEVIKRGEETGTKGSTGVIRQRGATGNEAMQTDEKKRMSGRSHRITCLESRRHPQGLLVHLQE
jgi:hypothetical protein